MGDPLALELPPQKEQLGYVRDACELFSLVLIKTDENTFCLSSSEPILWFVQLGVDEY